MAEAEIKHKKVIEALEADKGVFIAQLAEAERLRDDGVRGVQRLTVRHVSLPLHYLLCAALPPAPIYPALVHES
jgi:hypothetical protein